MNSSTQIHDHESNWDNNVVLGCVQVCRQEGWDGYDFAAALKMEEKSVFCDSPTAS